MKFIGDYHLHTRVSDGRSDISDYVKAAKEKGLDEIAISDHSFSTLFFHATEKKLKAQREAIASFADSGIKVYQGIEGNIIGGVLDVPETEMRKLDVLTVGFHRFITPFEMRGESRFLMINGFGSARAKQKLKEKNTEAYLSVLKSYPVDIVAHLGHRAPVDFKRVCECAKENGAYIELNAKHLDTLKDGIQDAVASGVNFIVGTDAHRADRTGEFKAVEEFIKEQNIPLDRVFGVEDRKPVFKNKEGWTYGRNV